MNCQKCSNDLEPITLEKIIEKDPDLFMFEQNNTCYCFMVYNLYRWVFQTNKWENEMFLEHSTNPLTGQPLKREIIDRLHKKYGEWLDKGSRNIIVNDINLSAAEIQEFRDEMAETGENAYEHAEGLIMLSDDEDEIKKIKAIYKYLTKKRFK